MTFFLTGYPSRLLKGSSSSGLGVINSSATIPSGSDRFIAIEFDTYNNGDNDPTGSSDHIGIDVNSMTSLSATRLPSYSLNGTMTATITFDNKTRMLDATLQFDADRSLAPRSVKTQLPDQLDALLPPVVSIGFSAATGGYSELHQIHSWSFNSTMAARGQGGFSVVYRGPLNNEQVAVKKIIKDSKGEFKDFLTERATIGNTRHMNVLKIEGWCCTISNFKYWFSHTLDDVMLFLVYELIANGNLHEHLYEKPEVLSWEKSSDVYSFGIVLLEIAHGENDPFLVHKLRTDLPETFVKDFADKKLDGKFIKTEMERVILLGLRCTERDENQRPSLITATHFLENGGELRPATTAPA
ncbi:hypothetical protein ACQ4PT_034935 [Festuca glaucescens]